MNEASVDEAIVNFLTDSNASEREAIKLYLSFNPHNEAQYEAIKTTMERRFGEEFMMTLRRRINRLQKMTEISDFRKLRVKMLALITH